MAETRTTTIHATNPKGASLLGSPEDELVGTPITAFVGEHESQSVDEFTTRIRGVRQGETARLEAVFEVDDGEEIWVELTVRGETIGGAERLLVVMREITERKRNELRLERNNEEMEFFNSLLRHDVLNGMTVIRTRADVLAEELDGDHRDYAETIVQWSDNVTDMVQRIRDVLDTLSGGDPELATVNLSELLRHQVESVSGTYPEVAFETEIPDAVTVTAGDLVADVFKNLLTNAVDHNDTEGLRIETTVERRGGTVTVRIADNGRGIPDEEKDTVFRRGTTGHVKKSGSGFGLFFVHAMVAAYGGEVHVEDNELGGATFVIDLPAASD